MTRAGKRSLRIARLPEDRLIRRERLHLALAFGGAVLLHASTAFSLVYWEPAEPVAPPGEMIITFDLEAAAQSEAQADRAGVAAESAPQAPQPPTLAEDEVEEDVVEELEPTPEPELKEEVAEVPKAEEAEVVIAPTPKKQEKKKPKPKPAVQSQAAAAPATKKSDVSGIGASASPSELNAYASRVRAAIERNKKAPAGGAKGTAHLAFSITRSGGIAGLRLSRSSGTAALDGAARTAVASAGIPPIPEGLPSPMNFGVPITFR